MNWLVLSYFLTAGLNFQHNVAIQDANGYHFWAAPDNAIETTLGAELLAVDHVFLAASVKTDESYIGGASFAPFLSEYNVKVGARFGDLEVGYVDDCTHPVLNTAVIPTTFLYGGWNGFYVSFKGSCKLF
jgi:hypothetical protein